uniref:Putative secreted protein n=1 Tax=Ixodes ricinus TaxID=34613 RepID=A0A6B0U2X4_IXORI
MLSRRLCCVLLGGGGAAAAFARFSAEEHGGALGIYIVGGCNLGSSETWPSTPVHRRRTWGAEERHSCFRIHNS